MRKSLYFLSLCFAVIMFSSCEDVHFKQPQPAGKKEIFKIPKKYQGNFSFKDNSFGSIKDDKEIGKIITVENGYPNLEIYKLLNIYPRIVTVGYRGKLEFTEKQSKILKEKMGWTIDTIAKMYSVKVKDLKETNKDGFWVFNYYNEDTMINISSGDVVKKYKGKLYLNQKSNDQKWVVCQLQKSGGKQMILRSVNKDDEDILKTLRPDDNKLYDPTFKEFQIFLKKGGFQDVETYNRE